MISYIKFALAELRIWGARKSVAREKIADVLDDVVSAGKDITSTYEELYVGENAGDLSGKFDAFSKACSQFYWTYEPLVMEGQSVFWDIPKEKIRKITEVCHQVNFVPSTLRKSIFAPCPGIQIHARQREELEQLNEALLELQSIATKLRLMN